jgi:hypothetical protein
MSVAERKRIAKQIDGLIRQRRISEDQLLHLMWLFSQEENVKITRNMTRRLLRLEKYSENTIKKVTNFLNQVEECPRVSPEQGNRDRQQQHHELPHQREHLTTEYDATADNQIELLREQEMKRRKVRTLKTRVERAPRDDALPHVSPDDRLRVGGEEAQGVVHLVDADVLNIWLVKQTKHCKSAKKNGPGIAAPYGKATALPVSVRIIPKKKKRRTRKAATRRASTAIKKAPVRKKPVDDEEEEMSSYSSEEEVAGLVLVDRENAPRFGEDELGESYVVGGAYDEDDSQVGSEEEDEVLLVDEEAEDDEDLDEDSIGDDVMEGDELSDDLGIDGSVYGRSSSDD